MRRIGLLLLLAAAAHAQNNCRFDLADQTDGATTGFLFSLVANAGSNGNCQLSSVMLELGRQAVTKSTANQQEG